MNDVIKRGSFLISNPYITDDNFVKSVVLICEYNERGAFGLVLNRPLNLTVDQILPGKRNPDGKNKRIFYGGPVDKSKLFCLHTNFNDNSHCCEKICEDVFLGGSQGCLNDLMAGKNQEDSFYRLYIGCSCWSEGQLENELDMKVWTVGPANENLVFYPNPDKIWWYVSQFIYGADPVDPSLN